MKRNVKVGFQGKLSLTFLSLENDKNYESTEKFYYFNKLGKLIHKYNREQKSNCPVKE